VGVIRSVYRRLTFKRIRGGIRGARGRTHGALFIIRPDESSRRGGKLRPKYVNRIVNRFAEIREK